MEKLFPIFLQTNYTKFNAAISDEDRVELKNGFIDYLNELPEDLRKKIIPKHLIDVISEIDSPIKTNGWHPALVLHFNQFIQSLSN